jgi:hypothetical protein
LKESKLNTEAKMAELQWQIDQQKEENKKIRGENLQVIEMFSMKDVEKDREIKEIKAKLDKLFVSVDILSNDNSKERKEIENLIDMNGAVDRAKASGASYSEAAKNGQWIEVKSPKDKLKVKLLNRKKNNFGKKQGTNIAAAEQRLFFYLGNFMKDTTVDDLKEYIENFLEDNIISIEELKSSEVRAEYKKKSFKVVTSDKHRDAMYNMENWPSKIFVRKFQKLKNPKGKNRNEGGN